VIHIAETLGTGSVEDFLTPEQVAELTALMDQQLAEAGRAAFDAERTATHHSIPDHTSAQAMAVYEPQGRVEIHKIPTAAADILAAATAHALPQLRRAMPSITSCQDWMYVEYGPSQHITAHLDGIALHPDDWPRQICGISVTLQHAEEGGAFYVETTSSNDLWTEPRAHAGYAEPMAFAHEGADNSATWFQTMPRTRWLVTPPPGTAVYYGSQVAHGTEPVRTGRERKFISWLVADQP
jgi:hypothetical protein